MSDRISELIAQIVNPRQTGLYNPSPITPMRADAPLPELIRRMMAAPDGPAEDAVPGVVAEIMEQAPQTVTRPSAVES
jgi:hypothetical protein